MTAELRFRLYGVDTPERGMPGYAEATAHNALLAPVGSVVIADTYKDADKYGRWLAELWAGEVNINDSLISSGLAKEYYGGTKT